MSALNNMNLLETATSDEVKKRFQQLAMKAHPDQGGTVEEFRQLRDTYYVALKESKRNTKCKTCNGTKRVRVKSSFGTVCRTCPDCFLVNKK
jgi:DnaJ-class molecular chaperone